MKHIGRLHLHVAEATLVLLVSGSRPWGSSQFRVRGAAAVHSIRGRVHSIRGKSIPSAATLSFSMAPW